MGEAVSSASSVPLRFKGFVVRLPFCSDLHASAQICGKRFFFSVSPPIPVILSRSKRRKELSACRKDPCTASFKSLRQGVLSRPSAFGFQFWQFWQFRRFLPSPFSSASSVPLCFKGFRFYFFALFRIRFIRFHPWYGFG